MEIFINDFTISLIENVYRSIHTPPWCTHSLVQIISRELTLPCHCLPREDSLKCSTTIMYPNSKTLFCFFSTVKWLVDFFFLFVCLKELSAFIMLPIVCFIRTFRASTVWTVYPASLGLEVTQISGFSCFLVFLEQFVIWK